MDHLLKEVCRSFVPGIECQHPGFMGSLCTRCGISKPDCGDPPTEPFVYIQPGLTLTIPEITRLRDITAQNLVRFKKLHLVLDLDHTLLHSTWSHNLTLEERYRLMEKYAGKGSLFEVCGGDVVVKLRPGARRFLEKVGAMFDLSVYTQGRRDYAEEVARLLDPERSRFGARRWRVMSREDCFMGNRQKRLDIVLAPERLVLIVDDTEKVWGDNQKSNLVRIQPYKFFSAKNTSPHGFNLLNKLGIKKPPSSRLRDNEREEKREIHRVFRTLKEVYDSFYGDSFMVENGDVRHVLRSVQKCSMRIGDGNLK